MNFLINGIIAVIVSLATFVAGVNVPPSALSKLSISDNSGLLGTVGVSSITTATNLASFPAIYNADMTLLDDGKVDVSTTTVPAITTLSNLATVGTITSGTWHGTAIEVAYNGTGTTSPSTYQVLLGNGASGITVASSTGTSGQFLTSNGSGAYPSWQSASVNQTLDYNFTGTNFLIKNLSASSTVANPIILNGVSYSFPTNQNASSSELRTDGSGALTWNYPTERVIYTSPMGGITGTTTVAISANTLLGINKIKIDWEVNHNEAGVNSLVQFGTGAATTTLSTATGNSDGGQFFITPITSGTQKCHGIKAPGAIVAYVTSGGCSASYDATATLYIVFGTGGAGVYSDARVSIISQ